jgi:ferredoxin
MEAEIKFEPEGRSGVVATGSYLYDAAKRLGVEIGECERRGETDLCAVKVLSGKNLLSEPTKTELETLGSDRFIQGYRLACQAKVIDAGEIVIMAEKKKPTTEEEEKEKERKKVDDFRKEFDEMPLEKKIATLLELETVALGETFSFVVNSPWKVFDKIFDVLAEFGLKMEKGDKEAKTPAEHKTAEDKNGNGTSTSGGGSASATGKTSEENSDAEQTGESSAKENESSGG